MKLLILFLMASFVLGLRAAQPTARVRTWPVLAMSFVLVLAFFNLRFV